jgi:hypothetical protein
MGAMMRVINEEKRDMDRSKGKRVHNFFLPPGSKILVNKYAFPSYLPSTPSSSFPFFPPSFFSPEP